jgi:coenzyme F420-reducing hydrogenase beta subunit
MIDNQAEKRRNFKQIDEAKIENTFLKGKNDRDLGVYCDLFSAKSSIEGQDGGVVSAILIKGFREGFFDAAVVIRRIAGYDAEALIATNSSDVLAAKGTIYLKVNITKKLRELFNQGKKRIAVVCTPCEVRAVRKIQQTLKNNCQIIVLGLFCFEAFNKLKLKEEIKNRLGVDLDKVEKTQVQKGNFIVQIEGKEFACRVKDLNLASEKACSFCDDFTSRFADISIGSVGSKQGYSTVIVRSEVGKKLLEDFDVQKEEANVQEIVRVSKAKRLRAEKTVNERNIKPKHSLVQL